MKIYHIFKNPYNKNITYGYSFILLLYIAHSLTYVLVLILFITLYYYYLYYNTSLLSIISLNNYKSHKELVGSSVSIYILVLGSSSNHLILTIILFYFSSS